MKNLNREAWLNLLAAKYLWPLIADNGGEVVDEVRISVGFPKGSRGGRKSIGQCWDPSASKDKHHEIFISPILNDEDCAHVLLHELIHASVGLEAGHKAPFKKLAVAVGLEGKMTATVAGEDLKQDIKGWLNKLPPFPGAPMKDYTGGASKPGSRLLKGCCPSCGYTVRITQKWVDIATPTCPIDGDEMLIS